MKIVTEDLWDSGADVKIVTANAYINSKGELVMGRGAALEAKQRYPDIPRMAGTKLKEIAVIQTGTIGAYARYGVLLLPHRLGLFQVKLHFKDYALLSLIGMSTYMLLSICQSNPEMTVAMNFPGIGYGGLDPEVVLPIIRILPDTVTIHKH